MKLWNIFGNRQTQMPKDVQQAFLKILSYTFLEIRYNSKKCDICFALSNHAHNIPSLISKYSPDRFKYYWEIERPSFIQKVKELECSTSFFEDHWPVLEKHYKSLK